MNIDLFITDDQNNLIFSPNRKRLGQFVQLEDGTWAFFHDATGASTVEMHQYITTKLRSLNRNEVLQRHRALVEEAARSLRGVGGGEEGAMLLHSLADLEAAVQHGG